MAQAKYEGNLEDEALNDSATNAVVEQLSEHPTSVVAPNDYKSAFKYVPEKMVS
jgi:hypothetical protein